MVEEKEGEEERRLSHTHTCLLNTEPEFAHCTIVVIIIPKSKLRRKK